MDDRSVQRACEQRRSKSMDQRNRQINSALRERFVEFLRYMHGGKIAMLFVEHLRAVAATTRRLVSRALNGAVWRKRGTEETDVRRVSEREDSEERLEHPSSVRAASRESGSSRLEHQATSGDW